MDISVSSWGRTTLVLRCGPCGVMQRIAPRGSQRTPATCIAATTPELTVGILKFSVLNFKKILHF